MLNFRSQGKFSDIFFPPKSSFAETFFFIFYLFYFYFFFFMDKGQTKALGQSQILKLKKVAGFVKFEKSKHQTWLALSLANLIAKFF